MSDNSACIEDDLSCKPIDTFEGIFSFVKNPPAWRTLCTGLTPHSEYLIRNIEVNKHVEDVSLANPDTFCHLEPGAEEPPRYEEGKLPQTLVCHDMANGYHDDCKIQGSSAHDAYTFYNWAGVDIFCYFSHHLVTVPPLAWINVAHAHGVKVIGTLITEWAEGEKFWEAALASEAAARDTAGALVAIAAALQFDGWLLNVENNVKEPEKLVQFVRALHSALHAALPSATLIWYDSVTVDGQLNWQNTLNDNNRAFFEACDGLFTNYSWREAEVRAGAAAAGARRRDLFVGVDVWGRNFYGGGQFNTQQAVKLVHRHGCSLAIFAPAWTHEAMPGARADADADRYQRFLLRDRALWDSLWPFLNTRVPSALPFHTSFCRGQGTRRRLYGEVYSPGPWYNLRHQQYQPNAAHGPHGYLLAAGAPRARTALTTRISDALTRLFRRSVKEPAAAAAAAAAGEAVRLAAVPAERPCLEPYGEDSFTGGACVRVHPSDAAAPAHRTARLLYCDFRCGEELVACVVTKTLAGHQRQWLDLTLNGTAGDALPWQVTLDGRDDASGAAHAGVAASGGAHAGVAALRADGPAFRRLQRHLLRHEPGFYVPVENAFGWTVRYYEIKCPGLRITSVLCRAGLPCGPVLLGHLGLCAGASPPTTTTTTSPADT